MTRDEAIAAITLGTDLAEPQLHEFHTMMILAFNQPGNPGRLVQAYALALYLGGTASGLVEAIDDPLVNIAALDGFADIPRFTPMLRATADLLDEIHELQKPLMNGHDAEKG